MSKPCDMPYQRAEAAVGQRGVLQLKQQDRQHVRHALRVADLRIVGRVGEEDLAHVHLAALIQWVRGVCAMHVVPDLPVAGALLLSASLPPLDRQTTAAMDRSGLAAYDHPVLEGRIRP